MSKISRRLSGVLQTNSRAPFGDFAIGRTWPDSKVTKAFAGAVETKTVAAIPRTPANSLKWFMFSSQSFCTVNAETRLHYAGRFSSLSRRKVVGVRKPPRCGSIRRDASGRTHG